MRTITLTKLTYSEIFPSLLEHSWPSQTHKTAVPSIQNPKECQHLNMFSTVRAQLSPKPSQVLAWMTPTFIYKRNEWAQHWFHNASAVGPEQFTNTGQKLQPTCRGYTTLKHTRISQLKYWRDKLAGERQKSEAEDGHKGKSETVVRERKEEEQERDHRETRGRKCGQENNGQKGKQRETYRA